jgi:hypothetical protein
LRQTFGGKRGCTAAGSVMTPPRPPWDFCSERRDKPVFKTWLNERLDEIDDPTPDDIALEVQRDNDPAYHEATSAHFGRMILRGQVLQAARARNIPLIEQLTAHDPEMRSLAFRELAYKHGRGREKGDRRPNDLMPIERAVLEDAVFEFKRARTIMRQHYGRWKGAAPTVLEIVAERRGTDPDQLRRFLKEHGSGLKDFAG